EITLLSERAAVRTEPPCPYFGECGGCQWQHVGYWAQLEAKQAIVERALGAPCEPIVPCKSEYEYRWRARQHVAGASVGYRAWRSRRVLDVRRCLLLPERLDAAIQGARARLPREGEHELYALARPGGEIALECGPFREGPQTVNLADPGEPPFEV